MKVVCVAGARPNFAKAKPVIDALEADGAHACFVHTGQHYDAAMSDVFFDELGLRPPDHHLGVGSGSQADQTARVMSAFDPVLEHERPDAVVVVGDVNSTMACALVAAKTEALVAHVEAGLRSRDWSMPEEINRVVTDRVSDLLLTPSPDADENLAAEGVDPTRIECVGNVMIDTLLANRERARSRTIVQDLGLEAQGYGLVTLHRPSNVDDARDLDRAMVTLGRINEWLPLVFPAHPRTRARLASRGLPPALRVIEPAGYLDFIALQASAALVITDSGGIQEETTVLGVPCLTARNTTERPITVSEGTNRLVGTTQAAIVDAALDALHHPPPPRRPALWDGRAGRRVADALVRHVNGAAATHHADADTAAEPA